MTHTKKYQVWGVIQVGMSSTALQPLRTYDTLGAAAVAASVAPVYESNYRYIWDGIPLCDPKLQIIETFILNHPKR